MRIRFDRFTLDVGTRQLLDGSREVHLEPRAYDLLALLIRERPNVLSKSALQQHLWPKTFVAEANLSNLVAEIRAALGDRARAPRFVRTVHRRGYAFCGEAMALSGHTASAAGQARCWLEWGRQRFPLSAGENIVGRDPDAQVPLDSSTVSRRHARLVLEPSGTRLEDLGSKNGTFRGDARVTAPVRLADGDIIRFGSLTLTFHARAPLGSTDTQKPD